VFDYAEGTFSYSRRLGGAGLRPACLATVDGHGFL